MRFVTIIVCLIVGGFLGWIAGSRYPAPQALVAWADLDAVKQRLGGLGASQTPAESAPADAPAAAEPAPAAQAAAPAASGAAADPETTLAQYRAWISEARLKHPYPDSEERMYAVMMCESRGQAGIVNPAGPYSGLFQYGRDAWNGDWNIYRDQNVLDARTQIFATALAWQNRMQRQWGCYTRAH